MVAGFYLRQQPAGKQREEARGLAGWLGYQAKHLEIVSMMRR